MVHWTQRLSKEDRNRIYKNFIGCTKGVPKSDEHKRRISAANKETYRKKKEAGWVSPHAYSRKNPQEVASSHIYRQYLYGAKSRNLEFALSKEDVRELTKQCCTYCGDPPRKRTTGLHHYAVEITANGIDRIDSTKGYTIENCIPACLTCNVMKNKASFEEFKSQVSKIYQHICI